MIYGQFMGRRPSERESKCNSFRRGGGDTHRPRLNRVDYVDMPICDERGLEASVAYEMVKTEELHRNQTSCFAAASELFLTGLYPYVTISVLYGEGPLINST